MSNDELETADHLRKEVERLTGELARAATKLDATNNDLMTWVGRAMRAEIAMMGAKPRTDVELSASESPQK